MICPAVGDIKKANEIGNKGIHKYIWVVCGDCREERWTKCESVKLRRPTYKRCGLCARRKSGYSRRGKIGKEAFRWRGGRSEEGNYIYVYIYPDDFFYPMANEKHRVAEHRLVLAKYLGRCLQSWERVHHKNGNGKDNQIKNLELFASHGDHMKSHSTGYRDGYLKGFNDGRSKQIQELKVVIEELRQEIRLLRWEYRNEYEKQKMPEM